MPRLFCLLTVVESWQWPRYAANWLIIGDRKVTNVCFVFVTAGRMRERSGDEERRCRRRWRRLLIGSFGGSIGLRWSGAGDGRPAASKAVPPAGDLQQRHRPDAPLHLLLRPAQRVPQVPVAGATSNQLRPRHDQPYPFQLVCNSSSGRHPRGFSLTSFRPVPSIFANIHLAIDWLAHF